MSEELAALVSVQCYGDAYETMGPQMRARLDRAELDQARVRDYIGILADRNRAANGVARELCALLGLGAPRSWERVVQQRKEGR